MPDPRWRDDLLAEIPAGETLINDPVDAEWIDGDSAKLPGLLGIVPSRALFVGRDDFSRVSKPTYPLLPVHEVQTEGVFRTITFGRRRTERFRVDETAAGELADAVRKALSVHLVRVGQTLWSARTITTYPGSTQRDAYITERTENGAALYFLESHFPLLANEKHASVGPWATPEEAFEYFEDWRWATLINR